MELKKKQVAIELRTVIDDQGEKELSIIKQKGSYRRKGNLEIISFVDEITDLGKVDHFITIQPGKISIKRSGSIGMNQQFVPGKTTESRYRHPYGSFHMEIFTKSIEHQTLSLDREGSVTIEYEATLNGQQIRKHHLTLIYTEEKQA